jgi:arylsulfatase A-like enzyme
LKQVTPMASRVRPTVVFIMADQLKWSALRMYSEIGIETPSLERLAGEGVMFRNAITPHPLCVPARTSVMTGRYPHSTGCRRNETLMPEDELHAFRVWKEAGYATGLIGKNHCFDQQSDLDLFDVRCELSHRGLPAGGYAGENVGNISMEWMTPEETINASHATRRNMPRQSPTISYAISDHELDGYGTAAITTQVEAFLERAAGDLFDGAEPDSSVAPRPFALWVSYPDPHEPYEAPRRYADMFPPDDVVMPPVRDDEFSGGPAPERNRVLHRLLSQNPTPNTIAEPRRRRITPWSDSWTTASAGCWTHSIDWDFAMTRSSCSPPTMATSSASTAWESRAACSTTAWCACR